MNLKLLLDSMNDVGRKMYKYGLLSSTLGRLSIPFFTRPLARAKRTYLNIVALVCIGWAVALLPASSWDELLDKLLAVQASLHEIGLELNLEKSTIVTNIPCPPLEVKAGDKVIPVDTDFVYLGVHFCQKGDSLHTYFRRVCAA
eukprot:4009699-Amphidinium_carterae.1